MSMIHGAQTVQELFDVLQGGEFRNYEYTARRLDYSLPESALSFSTVRNMKYAVTESGSHYFDKDAVRYFRGKTDTLLFGGRFWVESRRFEYQGESDPREYQVAYVYAYGDNLSIEKLGSFDNLLQARWTARRMAELVEGK